MAKKLWHALRTIDEDRSTFKDSTSMLLLRLRTETDKEYKLLEYNALEETFYNPMTDEFEDVDTRQPKVDYINLDEI